VVPGEHNIADRRCWPNWRFRPDPPTIDYHTVPLMLPMHTLLLICVTTLPAVGGAALAADGGPPQALRIAPQTSAIASLARALAGQTASVRWEFANIALDVLLEVYREQLQQSAQDGARSPQRRAKLARWQRATTELIAQIEAARLRLVEGQQFDLLVDAQQQVLIVAGGTPIALSGFDDLSDRALESRVLTRFCAFNDCSMLASRSGPAADIASPAGHWWLRQDNHPAYRIGEHLACEFTDMSRREEKARLCAGIAAEATELAEAIDLGRRQGHGVDWPFVARQPPTRSTPSLLRLNPEGSYLEMPLPHLRRLSARDWEQLTAWLESGQGPGGRPIVLRDLDDLLVVR
jgi:hypothetical protein